MAAANIPSSSSGLSSLLATAGQRQLVADELRRKELLIADLQNFKGLIESSRLQDEITLELKNWNDRFLDALQFHRNPDLVKEEFLTLLEEMLRDPFNVPLRRDALLGSDGKTYSRQALSLYLHSTPEEERRSPPLSTPQDPPVSFTTEAHPIVSKLIDWLEQQRPLPPLSEALENAYAELVAKNELPTIPTVQSEKIRSRRERRRQQNLEAKAKSERLAQNLAVIKQELAERVQQEFAPLHERVDAAAQTRLEQIAALSEKDKEKLDLVERRIEELHTGTQQLEEHNEGLRRRFVLTGQALQDVKVQDAKLAIAINDTRIAIRKRKEREARSTWTAIAVVGLCMVGGWALGSICSAAGGGSYGISAGMSPAAGGGKIGFAVAF